MRFALFLILLGSPAFSADIIGGGDAVMGCDLTLRGTIAVGDLDKVKRAVEDNRQAQADAEFEPVEAISPTICLDSPGGSLAVGIQLAKYFNNSKTITAVSGDTRCESACAIAFLGGATNTFGTDSEADRKTRRLAHPTARLGFHAPSLAVEDGNYSADSVGLAYSIALEGIGQLQKLKEEIYITDALMSIILTTPPDSMTYLTTVRDSASWHIQVLPTVSPDKLTNELVMTACNNMNLAAPKAAGAAASLKPTLKDSDITYLDVNSRNSFVYVEVDETYRYPGKVLCKFGWDPLDPSDGDPETTYMLDGELDVFMALPYAWFAPDVMPLVDLARRDDMQVEARDYSAPIPMLSADQFCMVLRDGKVTSDDPCKLERSVQGVLAVDEYTWPSGARTTVDFRGEIAQVNGNFAFEESAQSAASPTIRAMNAAATARGLSPEGWMCWLNMGSGNHFCVLDTARDGATFAAR